MKTLLLAAMLQSSPAVAPPTLPAGEFDAALRCSTAWIRDNVKSEPFPSVELISQVTWFISHAARLQPGGQDYMARTKALMSQQMSVAAGLSVADAHALAPQCAARFPLAGKSVITLPADALQRDAMCAMTNAVVSGMAGNRDSKTGGSEAAEPTRAMNAYMARITDARVKSLGISKDAYMLQQLAASVDVGNYFAVARNCAAAL